MGDYIVTGRSEADSDSIGSIQPGEDLPANFGLRHRRQQIQSDKVEKYKVEKEKQIMCSWGSTDGNCGLRALARESNKLLAASSCAINLNFNAICQNDCHKKIHKLCKEENGILSYLKLWTFSFSFDVTHAAATRPGHQLKQQNIQQRSSQSVHKYVLFTWNLLRVLIIKWILTTFI